MGQRQFNDGMVVRTYITRQGHYDWIRKVEAAKVCEIKRFIIVIILVSFRKSRDRPDLAPTVPTAPEEFLY